MLLGKRMVRNEFEKPAVVKGSSKESEHRAHRGEDARKRRESLR